MSNYITSSEAAATGAALFSSDRWFDRVEEAVRGRVRGFIEEVLEAELTDALQRRRYQRAATATPEAASPPPAGHRHGHRKRSLTGSFGTLEIDVPRARLETRAGGSHEWKRRSIEAYQRRRRKIEALIAGAYLSGTNTRRVKRALASLFERADGQKVLLAVQDMGGESEAS